MRRCAAGGPGASTTSRTASRSRLGEGRLFLFGPKITFRAQSHGTFPFLFNGIHYGAAREVTLSGGMVAGGG